MNRSFDKFLGMLVLNLLASYLPGILWVPAVVGSGGNLGLLFLISPVVLLILSVSPSASEVGTLALVILGDYVLLTAVLAWCFNWSKHAFFVIPGLLFVISFAQGLLFAEIIHGIDAIGHS